MEKLWFSFLLCFRNIDPLRLDRIVALVILRKFAFCQQLNRACSSHWLGPFNVLGGRNYYTTIDFALSVSSFSLSFFFYQWQADLSNRIKPKLISYVHAQVVFWGFVLFPVFFHPFVNNYVIFNCLCRGTCSSTMRWNCLLWGWVFYVNLLLFNCILCSSGIAICISSFFLFIIVIFWMLEDQAML